jgi:hypothetical protein
MLDSLNRVSDMGGLVNNPDHLSLFTRTQLLKTPLPFGEISQIGPEVGLTDEVAPESKKMPSLPNGDVVLTGNENAIGGFGVIRNIYALCEFIVLVNCLTHLCHETVFRINKMNISNIKRERERKKKKQKERKREREAVEQK